MVKWYFNFNTIMIPRIKMNPIEQLQQLLITDVMIEVNENIQELTNAQKDKPKDKNIKEQLKYMQEVKQYFDEVLEDIKLGKLKEKDAIDILEGLEDMRVENQEV